ncbi:MAG: TIGR02757 family protein [Flavobacteriaceae bacterium]|nr:TIGR02757 family protein [Flavobacteriaceae bacterium]
MKLIEIHSFLETKSKQFNRESFVEHDPIQIPHQFGMKQDIEIAALLAATIAWGNRKSIIRNAKDMMQRMDYAPYDFVTQANTADLKTLNGFVHRTFNDFDFKFFVQSLHQIYQKHESLEDLFLIHENENNPKFAIDRFRNEFLRNQSIRTSKHLSSPAKNSASKRLNMFLRWMVRNDNQGVDFGIWTKISPSKLSLPLDVHTGNVARKLGILERKQNDWRAVEEIDSVLRSFDAKDPVKYDFALFGLGAHENF